MNPSAWTNLLYEMYRATALVLILVSVLAAGVAHAHVDDVKTANSGSVVALFHDRVSVAHAHANAIPSHCLPVASCHTLFLVSTQSDTFEPESVSVEPQPLHYSSPRAPVYGLFRPPRRG